MLLPWVTLCDCITKDLFGSLDLQLFGGFIQFIGFTVIWIGSLDLPLFDTCSYV